MNDRYVWLEYRYRGTAGRIVRIDEFVVDIPSEGCIVVLRNRDVPGVVGRVGTLLGESGREHRFLPSVAIERVGPSPGGNCG